MCEKMLEEYETLRTIGIDSIQGYLFSLPVEEERFEQIIEGIGAE